MQKRTVCFEVKSQNRNIEEWYQLSRTDDAEKVGQALIIWFNLTGGNSDGSQRTFIKVKHDFYGNEEQFDNFIKENDVKTGYRFERIRPINVLDENYEELLGDDFKKYRGDKE